MAAKLGAQLVGCNNEIRLKGHVQVRQTTLPLQRMLDDRIEIVQLRPPVQHAANAIGGGNRNHDVAEAPVDVSGQGVIDYCDEATERFKRAGRTELHGILYLHAAQPGRPPGRVPENGP